MILIVQVKDLTVYSISEESKPVEDDDIMLEDDEGIIHNEVFGEIK